MVSLLASLWNRGLVKLASGLFRGLVFLLVWLGWKVPLPEQLNTFHAFFKLSGFLNSHRSNLKKTKYNMFNKWAHYDCSERVQYFYLETFTCIKRNATMHSVFFFSKILDDKCKEFSTHLIRNASQSSGIEAITFGTCTLDELIQECYRFFTMFILIFHHAGLKKHIDKYCMGKS